MEVRDRDGRRWFGKRLHVGRQWRGELQGHRWWGDLAPDVPLLRSYDEELRVLVTAPVPGTAADPGDRATSTAAGVLLRRLHAAAAPVSDHAGWLAGVRHSLDFEGRRCAMLGTPVPHHLVATALAGLVELGTLRSVPTHGDFLPHNWMVDECGRVATLDFAESAVRPAAYDVARLVFGPAWSRPELLDGFLEGYGRSLDEEEQRFVRLHLVVNAATAVGWGTTHGVASVRDRGHEVLAWLKAASARRRAFAIRWR